MDMKILIQAGRTLIKMIKNKTFLHTRQTGKQMSWSVATHENVCNEWSCSKTIFRRDIRNELTEQVIRETIHS